LEEIVDPFGEGIVDGSGHLLKLKQPIDKTAGHSKFTPEQLHYIEEQKKEKKEKKRKGARKGRRTL